MPRKSSRSEKNGSAKHSETMDEELNWAVGLARWTAFESKHGSAIVPDEDPDQQLLRWTKKQRKDYWNWKKGRPAYLGEESFQMLTRFGFHWGEDEDNAVGADDPPSSETAAKPSADQTKTQPGKRKSLHSSEVTPLEITASEETPSFRDSHKKHALESDEAESNEATLLDITASEETPSFRDSHKKHALESDEAESNEAAPLDNTASEEAPNSRDSRKKKGLASSEATPLDNTASEQKPTSRKKKAATRSKRGEDTEPEEPTNEEESTDTDVEEKSASTVTGFLRRSTRQVTLPPPFEVYGEASKPAATGSRKRKVTQAASPASTALKRRKLPTREVSRKQAPKASKAGAKAKSGKAKEKSSGEHSHKTLKRVISPIEEEDVPGQVRKEFADILKCDELLEPNKDAGVNIQAARFNQNWEERFFELLVFVKTFGHTLVPKVYDENKALGRYVAKMRSWFKSGDPHLTPSRQKRLEAIDFSWDAKSDPNFWRVQNDTPQASDIWEERLEELLAYKKANGDCMVPKNYPPNQTLARWVSKQRRHFRARKEGTYHTLDDEKVAKLVEADFVFETKTHTMIRETVLKRFEGRWDYFFDLLVNFKKLHGHCAVPRRWKTDQPLASWTMRQRFQWKKMQEGSHSYLTEERLERLKDIEFVFQVDRKHVYPIDGSAKPPSAAATKSTGRRAKSSTPASELTIDADEESASGENENSDGESEKKPAAKIPKDAMDSDGEDDEQTVSVIEEEEEEQSEVQEEESPATSKKGDADSKVTEEEEEQPEVQEEESPGASKKRNDDGEVVEEKQVADEEGDLVVSDNGIVEEAKAPSKKGSLGDVTGEPEEETKAPDEKGGSNGFEERKTTDGVDALLLFAGEPRNGDDDNLEEKTKNNEAEALLLLAAEKGEISAVAVVATGNSTPAAASKKSMNRKTKEKATGGTMEEPVAEDKHDSDAAGVLLSTDETPQKEAPSKALTNLKKGVWTCPVCEEDDFQHFIDAAAHEAGCTDLVKLAIPTDTQLD